MQLYPVPENLLFRAASRSKPSVSGKLDHVVFEPGQQLWEHDSTEPFAFFPLRGVVSLQISPGDGKHVEVALVGREGYAGVGLEPGAERTPSAAVSLTPGEALIMSAEVYRRYLTVPAFRDSTEQYLRLYVTMITRVLSCTRVHVIEKVCVSRLLQLMDRLPGDTLHLTQDTFAKHLGVRRATVSRVLTGLQRSGAISYDRRGRMTISDRHRLEDVACPCYFAIKGAMVEHVNQLGGL
jgi:CRP-like cAMP-binding protein